MSKTTKTTKTHAEVVREMKESQAVDQAAKYSEILTLAEKAAKRGDHVIAEQYRQSAVEFSDTRMTAHARRIAGIG